ncbi:MAG: hypothetical protein Q7S06_02665 [Nanoarchaeota archaeon]|nr:hypothetical protein [Nanoarchaeota archaeon]
MAHINDKVNALSEEEKKRFQEALAGVQESTDWLVRRGFDKVNYDIIKVKEILHGEMFRDDEDYFQG